MTIDPYALAFPASEFALSSTDVAPGAPLPAACFNTVSGANQSPELTWGPLPEGTRSVVVTGFDPDAPIPGGLWHWAVKDIPAAVPGLPRDAGRVGGRHLPAGSVALVNDLGVAGYSGVNPPPGSGTHRLVLAVTALDAEVLDLPAGASLAVLNIAMITHTLGRALLVGTSQAPPR